jgi:hypothetical protein
MTLSKILTATFSVAAITAAGACPDCALQSSGGMIEPQTMTSKMAFSSSTLVMLGLFLGVVSFMLWMMVKTCRELAKERPLSSISGVQKGA